MSEGFHLWLPLSTALVAVAVALVAVLRRSERLYDGAGLLCLFWCGTALLARARILYLAIRGAPDGRVPWLDLGIVSAVLLVLLPLPRRWKGWATLVVVAATSFWVWGDLLHLRFFGDVAILATLLAAGNGGDLWESGLALTETADRWLAWDLLPALVATLLLSIGRSRPPADDEPATRAPLARLMRPESLLFVVVATVLLTPALMQWRRLVFEPATGLEQRVFLSANLVRQYGFYGFHARDAALLARQSLRSATIGDGEVEELTDWFADRAPKRRIAPPWGSIARGKNLIIVQVESMHGWTVLTEFKGSEITPNINRLSSEALVYTAAADQSGVGRTSDSELLAMTSLLPAPGRAASFGYSGNEFVALPGILGAHDYTTLSAVAFTPSFWNRHITHPGYGFQTSLFRDDFEPGRKIGWGLNDRDFLLQMLDRIEQLEPPYFAYLLTLSLHFPYKEWPEDLAELPDDVAETPRLKNYLEAMHFADKGFGAFFEGLRERGLLDDTVVVLFGDHDSTLNGGHGIAKNFNFRGLRINWNLMDNVPLLIWTPGDEAPSGQVRSVVGLSDLPVTLLALLGIDPAPYALVGRNLLGALEAGALPRSRGHWVSDDYYFQREPISCFSRATRREIELDECDEGLADDLDQRWASGLVLKHDLQSRITSELHRREEQGDLP